MERTARAVIIDDNRLLVFFRRKIIDGKEITYYAIPGGHVEDNESCENTVVRELKEETNLDIKVLCYLGKIIVDNHEENYYHCEIIGGKIKFGGEELEICSDSNYYEIRWLSISELDGSNIRAKYLVKRVLENED